MADSEYRIRIKAEGDPRPAQEVGKSLADAGKDASEAAKGFKEAGDAAAGIASDETLGRLEQLKQKVRDARIESERSSLPQPGASGGIRGRDRGVDLPDVAFPGSTNLAGSIGALGPAAAAGGLILGIGKASLDEADQVQAAFGRMGDAFTSFKDSLFSAGGEMIDFVAGDLVKAFAEAAEAVVNFLDPKKAEDRNRHAEALVEHTKKMEQAAIAAYVAEIKITGELEAQAEQMRIIAQLRQAGESGISSQSAADKEQARLDRDRQLAQLALDQGISPQERALRENQINDEFGNRQVEIEKADRAAKLYNLQKQLEDAQALLDGADSDQARQKAISEVGKAQTAIDSERNRQSDTPISLIEDQERQRQQIRDLETARRLNQISGSQNDRAGRDAAQAETSGAAAANALQAGEEARQRAEQQRQTALQKRRRDELGDEGGLFPDELGPAKVIADSLAGRVNKGSQSKDVQKLIEKINALNDGATGSELGDLVAALDSFVTTVSGRNEGQSIAQLTSRIKALEERQAKMRSTR